MTPYGAIKDPGPVIAGEFTCRCHVCGETDDITKVFADKERLASHNLYTICQTVLNIRKALSAGTLDKMLEDILEKHSAWFPLSALPASWRSLHD